MKGKTSLESEMSPLKRLLHLQADTVTSWHCHKLTLLQADSVTSWRRHKQTPSQANTYNEAIPDPGSVDVKIDAIAAVVHDDEGNVKYYTQASHQQLTHSQPAGIQQKL